MQFEFPTYSNESKYEGPATSYFSHVDVEVNRPTRLANGRQLFTVDITADWHDSTKEAFVQNLKFEFSEKADLTSIRAEKLLNILAMFSTQFVSLYTTLDYRNRLSFGSYAQPGMKYMHALQGLMRDLNWQNKVGGFTQGFSPNIKVKPKTDTLPQELYQPYEIETNKIPAWAWPTESEATLKDYKPEEVALCASFGKEMLLTWSILKETYGPEVAKVKLCSNEDYDLPFYKVFKELAVQLGQIEKMELDFRQTCYNLQSDHVRLNNKPKELYFYLHILAVMFAIETGCKLVLWGSEHERSYIDDVVANGMRTPSFTYDYDQSQWMAAKINHLFEEFGLDLKLGSVLSNITEIQVQWLLWKRDPQLLPIQYSCIEATPGRQWCCECTKCKLILTWCKMMGIPYSVFPSLKLGEDGEPIYSGMATASYEKCVDGWLSMGDKHPIKQELTNYWLRPYYDMIGETGKIKGSMLKMKSLWPSWPCQVLYLTPSVKSSLERDLNSFNFAWKD